MPHRQLWGLWQPDAADVRRTPRPPLHEDPSAPSESRPRAGPAPGFGTEGLWEEGRPPGPATPRAWPVGAAPPPRPPPLRCGLSDWARTAAARREGTAAPGPVPQGQTPQTRTPSRRTRRRWPRIGPRGTWAAPRTSVAPRCRTRRCCSRGRPRHVPLRRRPGGHGRGRRRGLAPPGGPWGCARGSALASRAGGLRGPGPREQAQRGAGQPRQALRRRRRRARAAHVTACLGAGAREFWALLGSGAGRWLGAEETGVVRPVAVPGTGSPQRAVRCYGAGAWQSTGTAAFETETEKGGWEWAGAGTGAGVGAGAWQWTETVDVLGTGAVMGTGTQKGAEPRAGAGVGTSTDVGGGRGGGNVRVSRAGTPFGAAAAAWVGPAAVPGTGMETGAGTRAAFGLEAQLCRRRARRLRRQMTPPPLMQKMPGRSLSTPLRGRQALPPAPRAPAVSGGCFPQTAAASPNSSAKKTLCDRCPPVLRPADAPALSTAWGPGETAPAPPRSRRDPACQWRRGGWRMTCQDARPRPRPIPYPARGQQCSRRKRTGSRIGQQFHWAGPGHPPLDARCCAAGPSAQDPQQAQGQWTLHAPLT